MWMWLDFFLDLIRLYNSPCIFCRIILMAEGKVAFSGPVTHALEFFKRYILLMCVRTMRAGFFVYTLKIPHDFITSFSYMPFQLSLFKIKSFNFCTVCTYCLLNYNFSWVNVIWIGSTMFNCLVVDDMLWIL